MKRGYSAPGIVISITAAVEFDRKWVRVLWSDEGLGMEKQRDLQIISKTRKNND
jgi:hypothetical protein